MNNKVACVIPAAGWGSVCPVRSSPKVLADLGDEIMLDRIINTVLEADVADSLVVVIGNGRYGEQVRAALKGNHYGKLHIVTQPERRGAADAVAKALPYLNGESHVLVTFGDMPLWRAETFKALIKAHLDHGQAAISMVTLRVKEGHRTEKYGRIVRDSSGRILAALEPSELAGRELPGAAFVNPSLYVFERSWLMKRLPDIPPTDKGDGFPAELHLPKLLPLAHDEGVNIVEVPLEDPSEALGVNVPEELDEVRAILRVREETAEILAFVREHRAKYAIEVGSAVPELWRESEIGFYLFGVLAVTPEFTGGWSALSEHEIRTATLERVRFEKNKLASAND
ncbi:MAG TPA: sugar phosphate nucleotidyltransferase [Patescibacteria group bacterium]|nr:sugar phosphate nucleotidyltransferase [Patescibacteria group bacterium]